MMTTSITSSRSQFDSKRISDGARWRKTYKNGFGETVREEWPGFGEVLTQRHRDTEYDAKGRMVRVEETGKPVETRKYDSFGEVKNVTYAVNGEWRKIATDTANALIDDKIWRVSSRMASCSDETIVPLLTTNMTQVSGLSLTNESCNVSIDIRGNTSESWSEFNPAMTKRISYARIPTATNIALTETVDGATVLSVSHSAVTNTVVFDAYRRETVRTDGRGNATTNAYDTLGRLASVTDPLGATTRYAYDAVGNLIAVTNALGNATIYEYDLRGNKTYEGGATYPVRYTYDDFNVMTNMTTYQREGRGNGEEGSVGDTTTWLYDEPTGLLTNKVYADGKGYSCTYTVDGRLQFKAEASGRWKEFLYNAWGELGNTIYSDGEIISTLRDAHGREVLETNNVASILKWRDEFGNVTNETISVGAESLEIERLYDDEGRAACLASGLFISYDASGKFSAISNNEAIVQYVYNSDGGEMGYTISLSNGMVFARNVYRDSEHPERIAAISNCVNGVLVENFDYDYDLLGRLVVRNSDTFCYNVRSEVVSSHRGAENAEDGYAYDDIGNLLVSYAGANTNSYSANNLNQYTSIHHASAPSSEDYLFYDLDGNLTNDSVFAYSYDAQNRLVSVLSNDVALFVNEYDSKSRRVKKVTPVSTTTYFYDDWNLIEERIVYANGTTSTIKYYWGKDLSGALQGAGGVGGLLYLMVDGAIYIPFYDNNGNITRYLDVNGSIVASYTYNAFGHLISKTGALADLFCHRFSTKFFDAENGLYYYGYRFYHPTLMRWLNRDPLGEDGGINLYTFCENDPVNKFDPNGCIPLDTVWDIANIIYDICVGDEVALAADIAALLVPYVPAGTTKLVKAARLSKVEKICPGVKKLEVTYKYNPYSNNHFQFENRRPPVTKNWKNAGWVQFTKNHKAQFRPGFTHQDAKNLVDKALQEAKLRGKIRPSELDKYIFDAGTNIGAHNGRPTSLIQLKVTPQGEIHIHPVSR